MVFCNNKKLVGFCFFIFSYSFAFSQSEENKDFQQLTQAMQIQMDAWNEGDVPTFMEYYWKSEKLKFIGKSGVTYGWQATYDRYLKNYPDRATMGKLTFDIISKEYLSKKVIFMVGKWHLERSKEKGNLEGHFSLVWKKIDGKWLIVIDHSS